MKPPNLTAGGSVIAKQGTINIQNRPANFIAAMVTSCHKLSLFIEESLPKGWSRMAMTTSSSYSTFQST